MNSLALTTDLLFWRTFSNVTDRGDHLVVATPGSPGYYWGNLLIFREPPAEGDLERWTALFDAEFGQDPRIRHRLFTWDAVDGRRGAAQQFVDAEYELEPEVTLTARSVHPPPHPNNEITIRTIESEEEWEEEIQLQVASRDERFTLVESYTGFVRKRTDEYRKLISQGVGNWYGAFLGDRLVGSLGLFHAGPVARFQTVSTHPEFRRRGICGTLVHQVAARALEEGAETLVMVADEEYHAAAIYESVGFAPHQRSTSLILFPPEERRS